MDPSRPIAFALATLLAPALVAGIALLLGWRLGGGSDARVGALGALGAGLAYLIGHAASLGGVPAFPPGQATEALAWSALGCAIVAALSRLRRVPDWAAAASIAAASAAGLAWTLRNVIRRWDVGVAALTVAGCAVAIALAALALERWADRRRGAPVALALWVAATSLALAQVLAHSAIYAQFGGTLAALAGAMLVFAWIAPRASFGGGVVATFTVVLGLQAAAGVVAGELQIGVAALAFASPLAAVALDRGPFAALAGWRGLAVRAGATAVVAGAALAVAWASQPAPSMYE